MVLNPTLEQKAALLRASSPGPRYTSYPPATAFTEAFGKKEFLQCLEAAREVREPFALYVHVPFCQQRCAFCACNVIITRKAEPKEEYLDALETEAALLAKSLGQRRQINRLHFGGGTPLSLGPEGLRRLWNRLSEHFEIDPRGELAIEVDPRTTSLEHFEFLRELGFSRVSFGVQDLDADVQDLIQRIQPGSLVEQQLSRCRTLGFQSVNFDLVYGLPGQSVESFAETLDDVIRMRPDRIAVYGFAFLPQRFGHQRTIDPALVPEMQVRLELQFLAYNRFVAAGYLPIGFDHFALADDELCHAVAARRLRRTFMGYTAWPGSDLFGLGVSSIGEVQGAYGQNAHKLSRYHESIARGEFAVERGYRKTWEDARRGAFLEDLLCHMQADLGSIEVNEAERRALEQMRAEGLVEFNGTALHITELGRFVARTVAKVFDRHLPSPVSA